jgi:hypothetical protein
MSSNVSREQAAALSRIFDELRDSLTLLALALMDVEEAIVRANAAAASALYRQARAEIERIRQGAA